MFDKLTIDISGAQLREACKARISSEEINCTGMSPDVSERLGLLSRNANLDARYDLSLDEARYLNL